MGVGVRHLPGRGILRAQHGALRRIGVDQDVGQVAEDFLFLLELGAVRLHGGARHQQHHLLEDATGARLVGERLVRCLRHRHRRAHDLVL